MKVFALILFVLATPALAGSLFEKNQFETHDQARQRQSAENYDAYKKRDTRWEIPPAYQGSAPGAERPGYNERYDPYTRTYR